MQLHNISNYNDERLRILKEYEADKFYAYVDTEGIATIGIGLNLQVHGMLVLQALGFDVTGAQLKGAALEAEQKYINQFVENINNNKKGLFWKTYTPNSKQYNQAWAALNAVLIARAKDPAYRDQQNFVSAEAYTAFHNTQSFKYRTFDLPSPWRTVSANLFSQVLDGYIEPGTGNTRSGYEDLLDTWLNRTGVGAVQPGLLDHNSKERLALLSLAFNSRTFGKDQTNTPWNDAGLPTLLGPKLTNALKNNNRAEAWYEIRYRLNAAKVHAGRRYKEANIFGLYNTDPTHTTEVEAKEIMRMFTRYEVENINGKKISDYESTYPPPANIENYYDSIKPASDFLVNNFAMGNTIDGWVLVGKGLDSYDYIEKGYWNDNLGGHDNNDLILGEKGDDKLDGGGGKDAIYGGEGNDILIGGMGNDTLIGGAGEDTYIFKFGDGNDTIMDSGGTIPTERSNLLYEDALGKRYDLGSIYKSSDGRIFTADGLIMYNNGVFSLPGGGTITLQLAGGTNPLAMPQTGLTTNTLTESNSDPLLDAFGINLITLPDDIPALPDFGLSNTIVGDLTPIDMDPVQEGIQYGYDQWGNVLVYPDQPEPGRGDILYDTIASDKIEGFGGNDIINVVRGSTTGEWVLGGDGNDSIYISASGNFLVEGGSGNDYIETTAATLDARIYGGTGDDEILTHLNGSGWLYGGEGYDLIDGDGLDNCIIEGGADSDIIFGNVNGDNQLFGGSRPEGDLATVMATLIAEGETAPDSGTKGDIVCAGEGTGNNFLFGSNGYDIIFGITATNGSGSDLIVAGGGNDLIIGDAGSMAAFPEDRYTWSFHIEVQFDPDLNSDTYVPVITGLFSYDMSSPLDNDDLIYAGTGNDFVDAGGGDDEVYGGAGNDTIFGIEGDDFIEGGEGDDYLVGDNDGLLPPELNGNDYIYGGAGNDSIWGDGGNDELYGGAGDDRIEGNEGNDYLNGGAGNDIVAGLEGDDYLYDEAGLNTLYGGVGNDVIYGGVDSDLVIGEAGADVIYGGVGNDELHGDASDTPLSDQGDDYIEGGAGNDSIWGYGGNDTLYGGEGSDYISGDAGDSYIDGGEGANTLIGGDGTNEIYAGAGDDQILGNNNFDYIDAGDGNNIVQSRDGDDVIYTGAGIDQIWAGAGADTIYGGVGNDYIYADSGNEFDGADFVDGEAGDDQILGAGGDDTLYGGDGNDYLQGDVDPLAGNDYLDGGAGADTLLGQAGDDILYGGTGNDYMQGDSGSDTYIFGRGDGADTIYNIADDYATAIDTIQINAGINDVTMTIEGYDLDLRISINGTSDSLLIWYWGNGSPYQADQIIFSDGTVLTPSQVEEKIANTIYGTSANNALSGGTGIDVIYGYAGNDSLFGGAGDDVLIGGVGNDTLVGGAGNDTYVFNIGDGVDTIEDISTVAEGNMIVFGQGITPYDLTFVINGSVLTINVGTNGDAIHLLDFSQDETSSSLVTRTLGFADGTQLALIDFLNLRPPVVLDPIVDQTAMEDEVFSFIVPEYTFYDFDINDTLTYSATLADGSALPSWLTFDPATVTFSGTSSNVENLSVKVTATDAVGHSVSDEFNVTVISANNAPVVANPINDQTTPEDAVFSFTVPANTFTDVDLGDTLTYSATLADGTALPSWLTFDPATVTFSGTPNNEDVGILELKVTAIDTAGASVSDEFNVTVQNVNDAPVVANPLVDQTSMEDAVFSFIVPANTFADEDIGDTLTYSATKSDGTALPSWLTFDQATLTFSGTPANGDVGTLSLKVTAIDTAGASVSDEFNIAVTKVNNAPVVANPIVDQTATEDAVFSFTVPANTFSDVDLGDTLTYSATLADGTALPSWLTFDPATMTFSGTPANGDVGPLPLKVTATDTAGASVSDEFNVTVTNVNDAPVVANPITDQTATEDAVFSFTIPANTFADVDLGDSLTYSATKSDGSALPSWLSFDPATMTFSGTPANSDVGPLSLKVMATDTAGSSVSDEFNVTVITNIPPVILNPIVDQTTAEDAAFNFIVPDNTFADLGDTLTYSATQADGSALPGWLTFNPTTRAFSGTPANEDVGTLPLKVTATDTAGASVSDEFNVTVQNVNDAPVVANPITDQTAPEDAVFSFAIPANTFADVDLGDSLTYNATLADGSALPSWLTFDPATMTISGTPANSDVGTLPLKVTATDTAGASVSDEFNVTVENVNDAPVVANPISDQTTPEDAVFSFTVPANTFADVDLGDSLTYNATQADGSALPGWLTFNPTTRAFSGTPANEDVGILELKVTATDTAGASVSDEFNVTVTNVNDAPMVVNPIGDQTTPEDAAFSFTVPANTFADVDLGDSLTYDATLIDGMALPAWLTFDPGTRTFNGTPTNDDVGILPLKVTATDTAGASVAGDFNVTVVNVNDAPVVANPIADQTTMEDAAFSFTVSANTFADVDLGDTLTYSATLADGTALPAWLTFDQATLTFSGTPTNDNVGTLSLKVTAADTAGASVSDAFNITVEKGNNVVVTYGTNRFDFIFTGRDNDLIYALDGIDLVYSGTGNDTIYGGNGSDFLFGDEGNDVIYGENGNDFIYGGSGNDTLNGGTRADIMCGGAGSDTYIVDNTYDVVGEFCQGGTDTVQSSITYTLGNNVENLTLTGTTAIHGTGNALDNVILGNSGNNKLMGGAGNDTLDGGAGNDSLVGGTGNDIYTFMQGYGQDTITDYDAIAGNSDKVQFGTGINPLDLILVNNGNNLDIQINDSLDLLTVQNQNSCKANQVEVFEAGDGSSLLSSQVDLLIQAMAGFSAENGGMSWTELIDQKPAEVQQILAQYWQPPK